MKNKIIEVQNVQISISKQELDDYICITDIAKAKSDSVRAADVVRNWLRNRGTLEYLSVWEQIYNPNFKVFESEHFKKQAGLLTFTPSVSEWVNETNAIGLYVKRGKYGGTYAHKDIAFEFASAISPVFKLYLIKEFQRLKEEENNSEKREWDAKRFLSKNNYLIQTDAVKRYLLPQMNYRENLQWLAYAEEADILNVALFGFTAKAWREANPELAKKNNVRDFVRKQCEIDKEQLVEIQAVFCHPKYMQKHQTKKSGARFTILKTHRRNWIVYTGSVEYNTINQKNYSNYS